MVDFAKFEQTIEDLKRKTEELELLTMDTQTWRLAGPRTYGPVNQSHADFLGKLREDIKVHRFKKFATTMYPLFVKLVAPKLSELDSHKKQF